MAKNAYLHLSMCNFDTIFMKVIITYCTTIRFLIILALKCTNTLIRIFEIIYKNILELAILSIFNFLLCFILIQEEILFIDTVMIFFFLCWNFILIFFFTILLILLIFLCNWLNIFLQCINIVIFHQFVYTFF